MKNTVLNKAFLGLVFASFLATTVHAQVSTTFSKNATPGQQDGVYYSLPQTVLRLDFTIRETQVNDGPYSDYAARYFSQNGAYGAKYELLDVRLEKESMADPNATFFVSLGAGRGSLAVDLDVLENGVIRSIGVGNGANDGYAAPFVEAKTPESKTLDVQDAGMVSLPSLGKSDDQMAKDIALKIEEIEKAKVQLNSGFYEVALDAATLSLMCQNLDILESQYKNMLFGKSVVKTYVKSVYVIPNSEVTSMSVAKFSTSEGLTTGVNGSGSTINVQTLPLNTLANVNAPSQSAVELMNYEGKVFYRIPELAHVKVTCSGKVLLEERVQVNQLGALLTVPVQNTRLIFNTETGQISSLKVK